MSTVSDTFSFDNIDPTLLMLSEHEPPAPKWKAEVPVPKHNVGDTGLYAGCDLTGQKLVCLFNPYDSPRTALEVGIAESHCQEQDIDMDLEEFSCYVATYEPILVHLPWLEDVLRAYDFTKIADKITTGMSEQRSMDLSAVKHTGLAYVPFNMDGKFIFDPPIPKTEDKSNQGFTHPQLAHLLCPHKKVEIMMAGLQDGSIPATTFNWPTFFYEDGVYDPEDQLKGLFQGHIAWWFYVHLFIGPSAASNGCNHAWNLLRVTPHIIVNVHIIAYLTLSLAPKWANEFGDIDLQAMSWMITEMFKHSDDWTCKTLEWHAFLQCLCNGTASKNKEQARPDPKHAKQASRNLPTSNVSTQICAPASSSSCDSDVSENTNNSIASINRPVIHPNYPEALAPAHKKATPVNKWHKKPVEQEDIFANTVDSPGTKTCNAMAHACDRPQVRHPPKKQKNGF
ncbi:hypothetical protein BKA82DRAFT_4217753 [Pisolithus tinctorius]|nr:hypothetical protein BKA82DRAFT_4217753 [Pisolithus tinctorius]